MCNTLTIKQNSEKNHFDSDKTGTLHTTSHRNHHVDGALRMRCLNRFPKLMNTSIFQQKTEKYYD